MSDNRNVLKTIVQSSTVELFQAYALAVAPVAAEVGTPKLDNYVGGAGGIYGPGLNATLSLLVPKDVYSIIKVEGVRLYNVLDWTRELTNQLMGRVKNRLTKYQPNIRTDLPSAAEGRGLEIRQTKMKPFLTVSFRTIRGEIWVVLAGAIDYTKLAYSGARSTAGEGELILF